MFSAAAKIAVLLSFIAVYLSVALTFRIEASAERVIFEEVVRYQVIEPLQRDKLQSHFEGWFSDRRIIRLKSGQAFWLRREDRKKLWPESPHEMLRKGYTIKARISAQPLYFGGFTDARLLHHERIDEKPLIRK